MNHDQEEEEEGRKGLGDGGREKKETKGMRQREGERGGREEDNRECYRIHLPYRFRAVVCSHLLCSLTRTHLILDMPGLSVLQRDFLRHLSVLLCKIRP